MNIKVTKYDKYINITYSKLISLEVCTTVTSGTAGTCGSTTGTTVITDGTGGTSCVIGTSFCVYFQKKPYKKLATMKDCSNDNYCCLLQ